MGVHVIVWEFVAREGLVQEFERAYGPDGDWARLFRRAPGYLGTTLIRDRETPRRFLTIDRWVSRQAFEEFRQQNGADYDRLDRRLATLNDKERQIGVFEER